MKTFMRADDYYLELSRDPNLRQAKMVGVKRTWWLSLILLVICLAGVMLVQQMRDFLFWIMFLAAIGFQNIDSELRMLKVIDRLQQGTAAS